MVATTFEGDAVIDPRTVDRLTNLTDINRLLHEVTIKERGIVVELEKRLERRQELDNAVLHLASITAEELEMARADAEQLVSELNVHAERARQVSERVRALDTSQQNVQRALGNVNGILDRSNCIKAVQQALGTGDYEEAARFIASCSGQGGGSGGSPAEAAAGSAAASLEAQQSQVLDEARQQLEREVRKKLGAAKDIQDHANVLRFVRLLPLLGREDEGVKELTAAVRRQVAALCMEWLQPMQKKLDQGDASFAEVLNGVLRVLGSTLGDHKAMVQQTFGGQAVLAVCLALQQECDNYGSRVLDVFMQKRQVAALLRNLQASGGSAGSRASGSASGETAPDPREVEAVLEEMRMLSFKGEEYLDWMLQQMRLSIAPQPLPAPAENGFRSGPFNVALQQLAGNYIVLEVFYMESSAAKAIQMDELGAERLTSSMVDDIFFVLRKSAMRSISLGSTQCACAVVGELNNFLANTLKGALHQKLQPLAARPKALLALAEPEAAEPPLRANGAGQSVEGVRTLAAALNNADVSGEYVQKLQSTLEEAVSRVMHQPGESERVRSVLSDLSKTSGELRALTDKAIDQVADALAAHLRAVVDKLSQSSYELTDVQYNAHEAEVTWERQLAATLQMLLLPLAELLTMRNQDALLLAALDRVLPRIEAALASRTYNMLGGLALDREVRSLVNALGELTQQSVRDRLARLIQMATVLSLEEAEEMLELWGEASTAPLTWRLSAAEIRGLMLRRKDWPEADVRRLSLG